MSYLNRIVLMVFVSVFSQQTFGQGNPQIIPVSPEAAALTKMVNYPVNMNTGIPDINIPLYEINVGGMKLPIALQYHAGGFRINEQATRAGLGWSLSSDLQITRTVNAMDDLITGGYVDNNLVKAYYPNPSTCGTCSYPFNGIEGYLLGEGTKDAAPDKFSYKLLNKSGSFYFQKNNAGTSDTIVPVPFDNIEIRYVNGMFIIKDTDGTTYHFGEPGNGDVNQLRAMGIETSGPVDVGGNCSSGQCVRSTWKCKRIVNNAGTDEITFTYSNKTLARYRTHQDYVEYYNNENPCNLSWNGYYTSNTSPMANPSWGYEALMQNVPFHRISSPKYMVVFGTDATSYFHVPYLNSSNVVTDRIYAKMGTTNSITTNVAGLSVSEISFRGGKVQFNGADKLSSIRILDANNSEVKTIYLFQSYTNAAYVNESKVFNGLDFLGTMYLDSLHVRSGTNTFERYALFYESKFCFGNHLKGHDAWGYPNANTMEIAYANNTTGNILTLPTMNILQQRFYRDVAGGCLNFGTNIPIVIGGNNWAEVPDQMAIKRGMLKRIVYPTGGFTDFDFESNQYSERFIGSGYNHVLPQLSGGLRIRSVNTYDADGTHQSQLYYRYGMFEEGTGLLINKPSRTMENGEFYYGAVSYDQNIVYLQGPSPQSCFTPSCLSVLAIEKKTTYQPASILNYTYANGAPIYYQKVTEYRQDLGQQSGKVVYEYYEPQRFHDFYAPLYEENWIPGTNISYQKTDGLMGQQKSVKSYEPDGAYGYRLVVKKEYEYERYLRPKQVRVAYSLKQTLYSVAEGNYSGSMLDIYASGNFGISNYVQGQYGIPSARMLIKRITETSYEKGDSIKTVKNYAYAHLPYLQPSSITSTNSKGQQTVRTMRYAYNFTTTPVYAEMADSNMISQLIEEFETLGGLEITRARTNYMKFPVGFGLIAPATQQSSVKGAALRTDITFNEYDQYGNVLQLTGRDGIPVSYLWGYQSLYPVAELKGVSYASIPNTYKSNLQIINPSTDAALHTLLSGLRTTFSVDKTVDTYSYKRLVGMTRHVDPAGRNSYYEYDAIGRLRAEKDHNGYVSNQYDYHLSGPIIAVSGVMTYASVPAIRSYSLECAPGVRRFFNRIIPGGKNISFNQVSADFASISEVEVPIPPADLPPCPSASPMVAMRLTHSINTSIANPSLLEVDFIKAGHVAASYRFFPFSLPIQESTVFLPPGEYQISVRISANVNYNDGLFSFWFTGPSYNERVDREHKYVLTAGQNYHLAIQSMFY